MATPVFVKVSPWTAKKLNLDKTRIEMPDGNYLLYQTDLLVFGPLFRLREYAERIGGAVMTDREAAANQRGELTTPLPEPTDPEWIAPEMVDDPVGKEVDEEVDEVVDEEITGKTEEVTETEAAGEGDE